MRLCQRLVVGRETNEPLVQHNTNQAQHCASTSATGTQQLVRSTGVDLSPPYSTSNPWLSDSRVQVSVHRHSDWYYFWYYYSTTGTQQLARTGVDLNPFPVESQS